MQITMHSQPIPPPHRCRRALGLLAALLGSSPLLMAEDALRSMDHTQLETLVAAYPDVTQGLQAELALRALDHGDAPAARKWSADLADHLGLTGARIHAEALLMAGEAAEADAYLAAACQRYQPFWPQALLLFRLHHGQGDVVSLITTMAHNSLGVAKNPYQRKHAGLVQLLANDYEQAIDTLSTNAPGVRQNYHQSSAFLAALEAHGQDDHQRRDALLDAYRKRLQASLSKSSSQSGRAFDQAMWSFTEAARIAWRKDQPVLPPGPPLRKAIADGMSDYLATIVNFYAGRAYHIAGPQWYPRAQLAYERAATMAPAHRNDHWESALAAHYLRHLLAEQAALEDQP